MNPGLQWRRPCAYALLLAVPVVLGCGMEPRRQLLPNHPPEVSIARATALAEGATRGLSVRWIGRDADGRIDHYVYALNPASVDKVDRFWTRTGLTSTVVQFSREAAIGRAIPVGTETNGPQIFAVRAVDQAGEMSAPAFVAAFDSSGLAPIVVIDNPKPNAVFVTLVSPTVEIRWHGDDPDGHVVKYKYRLFGQHNPDHPEIEDFVAAVTNDPDLLRRLYAPTFTEWDSAAVGQSSVRYTGLSNQLYVFAITAFDNDGNYDPVFSNNSNVLRMYVTDLDIANPQLCVSSPIFNYCSPVGGDLDLVYEIPSNALTISWLGLPAQGNEIAGYRWALDPPDTTSIKEHGHSLPNPDRWTGWSLGNTSTTVGPFADGTQHILYVQAKDNVDHVSTLRLRLSVVGLHPTHELLVVDDTRLFPDMRNPSTGLTEAPRGTWPTAAELDTFLYARGGYPWKDYPAGTVSPPGILNGYDFDTLGTRGIAGGIVPLSLLSQYRQVMWFTDDVGATYVGSPLDLLVPITSLRLMSQPGQVSTLSEYTAQGGRVWVMGGGAAYATLIAWGKRNTPADDWTNLDGELVPGRFMYDFPHWQSVVGVRPGRVALLNTPDFAQWANAATGRGWSGHGMDHTLSQPDYGKLAAIQILQGRTCATDPPPPQRFCNSFYLLTSYTAEFIGSPSRSSSKPNYIQEDVDPRPNKEQLESTLDTLYLAAGGTLPSPIPPVMTYYHGFESGPVVFSGFPPWYFQRAQCQKLFDFVLQDIWGLTKTTGTTAAAVASRRRH
jgi:hypothetical protein